MAGLDFPLSTLHPSPHGNRRMTRGRIGTLSLHSCGSFIRYSPPAFTGAFPDPFFSSVAPFHQAILFLYEHVLGQPLNRIEGVVRARCPKRLPVVLTG